MREFKFNLPLYSLRVESQEFVKAAILDISGAKCLALYTERGLAENAGEKFGLGLMTIDSKQHLLDFLNSMGIQTHVIFDPTDGQTDPAILPVDAAIRAIQEN